MTPRQAIESLYIGRCDVFEYMEVVDPVSHITTHKEVKVLENQPCRLSYSTLKTTNQTEVGSAAQIQVKLFISNEVKIKPGSKITVMQNNVSEEYSNSGQPARYSTHQEIQLGIFKGWA